MATKQTANKKSATHYRKSTNSTPRGRLKSKQPLITKQELTEKLSDIDISDEELSQYFKVESNSAKGFAPEVVLDESKIEGSELEGVGLLQSANAIARWRRNRIYARRLKRWNGVKIVAEGDSWFQYPFLLKDTIDQLNDLDNFQYAIFGLSEAGDLLDNMIREDELTKAIEEHSPHVFLISGGGNDMVGDERMASMVHPYSQARGAADYPNEQFDDFLGHIAGLYRALFQRLILRFPHLKILCHGYDKAIPDDGEWLGKPLEKQGIKNSQTQTAIVAEMIDRFNNSLSDVVAEFPGRVYFVDCRDLIGSKSHWHDELHPKNDGYYKVAELFDETIKRALKEDSTGAPVILETLDATPSFYGSPALKTDISKLSDDEFIRLVTHRANEVLPGSVEPPTDRPTRRAIESQLEKIHLERDFLPSRFLEDGAARSQAVCLINIRSGIFNGTGSGFLIGTRNFIMTNNHVLPDVETARNSHALFDYDQDAIEYQVSLLPDRFFITDAQLDFTIVACDPKPLPFNISPISFPKNPYIVTRNERVNIVQHPRGRQKEVSIHDNKVTYVYQEVIRYRTDTEGGSSGSPVFNNNWELCALHHAGVKNTDGTATNEGINISAILDFLRSQNRREVDDALSTILTGETSKPTPKVSTAAGNLSEEDKNSSIEINLSNGSNIVINV